MRFSLQVVCVLWMAAYVLAADSRGATFTKPSGSKLRIASYNVFRSSVFPNSVASGPQERTEGFARLAKAVKADIWALQEMFYGATGITTSKAQGVANYMKGLTGQTWYVAGDWATSNPGEVLLSRFPIKWQKEAGRRTYATLIDLTSIGQKNVLILNVHFMKDDHGKETGAYISKVLSGGESSVPKDTPIVVCGDFNAVYGSVRYKFVTAPGLKDVYPVHLDGTQYTNTHGSATRSSTGDTQTATWKAGGGRIDHFLYRQSNGLPISNQFILNTFVTALATLTSNNLKRIDVALDQKACSSSATSCNCDHLPIVTDFGGTGTFKPQVSSYEAGQEPAEAAYDCCEDADKNEGFPEDGTDDLDGVTVVSEVNMSAHLSAGTTMSVLLLLGLKVFWSL